MADNEHQFENWRSRQSIRIVIEGLAVAGILWLAVSVQALSVAIARVQTQMTNVQTTLASVPHMQDQVTKLQTIQDEHERRLNALEQTPRRTP